MKGFTYSKRRPAQTLDNLDRLDTRLGATVCHLSLPTLRNGGKVAAGKIGRSTFPRGQAFRRMLIIGV